MTPEEVQSNPAFCRALRVLRMVYERHKLGYQRVRIMPAMAPSGCFWRCSITHAGNILKSHGAESRDFHRESAHYSSADENNYFGWNDAAGDTVQQLAARFLERFPEIARLGQGLDWSYAGWSVQMLGFAERGELPIVYQEYLEPDPTASAYQTCCSDRTCVR